MGAQYTDYLERSLRDADREIVTLGSRLFDTRQLLKTTLDLLDRSLTAGEKLLKERNTLLDRVHELYDELDTLEAVVFKG